VDFTVRGGSSPLGRIRCRCYNDPAAELLYDHLLGSLVTGAVVSESVELATILLTDLVGSTRLATSVGPVRADQLREEHFGLLRQAIASTDGQEVKNLGDGLMVAFGSASGAVSCAVAMQQLFERRYGQAEQGLHVRIGLGAGESTVKDGDYFGMPTVEAARLCAQAPADGILISALVKTLAGRCDGVEFTSAGELELKGFREPVEAFSVSWAPLGEEAAGAGGWPLPAVLRSVPPVSYVGRVEERAAIEEAMVLARDGARQVVLLSGEPGIGKTRLSSYGAHRAHAEGFAVCWGACSEELAVPYEPWIEVCSQLVEHAPQEVLNRLVERHKGELGRLARNLERRVADLPAPQTSDPETERYLLFSAVAGLLQEIAQSVPVCLVLDDLHWADGQSVALLKHVVRTVERGALQVIATYRDSDLGKDHPLSAVLADLRSIEGVQRIALRGLGADEVAQIMTVVAGYELDADILQLAGQIAAETDGNPFFVGEILRGLWESGALAFDEASGRWSVDRSTAIALPESVREVIERRVERLGNEALEVLTQAAVIGRVFDLELLESVLDTDESRLLDHLEAAVAASLLGESSERVGRFRFAHALINQTLYEGLGATRRARMHQRVAQALEKLYGEDPSEHLTELALHWRLAAVSVDRGKAADYALRAGQRALESLAPAEAVKLFADAVELMGDVDSAERCEALIGLGEAQLQSGDAAYRETLLDAARIASALGDAELAARAALANNRGGVSSTFGEIDAERLAAIERAIELDDPPSRARRARLLAIKALELEWDPDSGMRRALAEEAVSLARATEDARTLAEVLRSVEEAIRAPDTLAWRIGLAEELVGCTAEVGDPALRFSAHNFDFHTCLERGDLERAKLALEQQELTAHELDQPTINWLATLATAGWELMHGDLVAGERSAERALQIGQEAGQPDAVFTYAAALTQAGVYQGRGGEIIEMVEQSVSAYPVIAAWRAGLASLLCWLDRRAEAAKILEQAASDRFDHIALNSATLSAHALYADAAVLTDSSGPASVLYELIEPWADQVVWNGLIGYGHARMWLGLLAACVGDHEQADQHLAFACDFQETNGLHLWAARAHLGWAEALAGRGGDAARAREHAARALELSEQHGYALFEERTAALVEAQSTA
jgi:class 3 adenylate cyclase